MKITADGTCHGKKIIVDESSWDVGLFNAMNMLLLARPYGQREQDGNNDNVIRALIGAVLI